MLAGTTATAAPTVVGLKHYAEAEFTANPADSAYLGSDVAIAGSTLAVLGYTVTDGHQNYAVYVFSRGGGGWRSSTPTAVLTTPFEDCLDGIATNGRTIVVGSDCVDVGPHSDQGEVIAYNEPKHGWRSTSAPSAVLSDPTATADDEFGVSVSMSGPTLVVGASGTSAGKGAEYVYAEPSNGFANAATPLATLTNPDTDDGFARAGAVSGNTVVVGAEDADSGHGALWVYVKPAGGWSGSLAPSRQLSVSGVPANAELGEIVAISGRTIVSSVEGSGGIFSLDNDGDGYVFTEPAAGWGTTADPALQPSAVLTETAASPFDDFAQTVAVCGSQVLIGAYERPLADKDSSGAVDVYDKPAGGWHSMKQTNSFDTRTTGRFDEFGDSVACSGSTIAVGAPDARYPQETTNGQPGAAYVFSKLVQPRLTKLSVRPKRWATGKRAILVNPKHAPKGGTRLSFHVNEPGSVLLRFTHKHQDLSAVVNVRKGTDRVYVDGPLGHGKHLTRGSWTVHVSAVDAAGDQTKAQTLHITVIS